MLEMESSNCESRWSSDTLKDAWIQMFDYELYQNHYENLDVQCILMLFEGGLSHFKKVLTAYCALKASEKELVTQLETKTHEYWALKKELDRPCSKCKNLETSLIDARKQAKDAQARMDSIANILRLGENLDPSQSRRRTAAIDLVSQMLLASSPPTKRIKPNAEKDTADVEVLAPDTQEVLTERANHQNGIIPSTMQLSPCDLQRKPSPSPSTSSAHSSTKRKISAGRSPVLDVSFIPCRSKGSPMSKTSGTVLDKADHVKKNLSVDLDSKPIEDSACSPVKPITFNFNAGPPPLDNTLKDYVRESTGKMLANIWFDDDEDEEFELSKKVGDSPAKSKTHAAIENSPAVIPETPNLKKKRADFWVLKDKHGPSESSKSSGRRMRQTKLELGTKRKASKVDLSKLPILFTSEPKENPSCSRNVGDEEIIVCSPEAPKTCTQESNVNTTEFRPLAASTQKLTQASSGELSRKAEETTRPLKPKSDFERLPTEPAPKEPSFVYARDAVKKKSERQKLAGWECQDCAGYYGAFGKNLNPSELKKRINACSKHRNKFKPKLNDTPPDFWNPLFPSSEEIKGHESVMEIRK